MVKIRTGHIYLFTVHNTTGLRCCLSGWLSRLMCCVKIAGSSEGVGLNPTSDIWSIILLHFGDGVLIPYWRPLLRYWKKSSEVSQWSRPTGCLHSKPTILHCCVVKAHKTWAWSLTEAYKFWMKALCSMFKKIHLDFPAQVRMLKCWSELLFTGKMGEKCSMRLFHGPFYNNG